MTPGQEKKKYDHIRNIYNASTRSNTGDLDVKTRQEKFNSRYERVTESGCWIWSGGMNAYGYGSFWDMDYGRARRAHRVSYELYKGFIPDGLLVLHKCDVPVCVNPDHLFLGTHQDNMDDKIKKGRQAKGENNGSSKLTEKEVKEIRDKYVPRKYTQRMLAREFNVSQVAIGCVIRNETWRNNNEE